MLADKETERKKFPDKNTFFFDKVTNSILSTTNMKKFQKVILRNVKVPNVLLNYFSVSCTCFLIFFFECVRFYVCQNICN